MMGFLSGRPRSLRSRLASRDASTRLRSEEPEMEIGWEPKPVTKPECKNEDHAKLEGEVRELKKKAWLAKQETMAAALEKPPAPYRLVRLTETGCWRVEKWREVRDDPEFDRDAYGKNGLVIGYHPGMGWMFPDFSKDPRVRIEWHPFGPHESFDTFEKAEAWLKGWLRPIGATVYYSEDGSQTRLASDGEGETGEASKPIETQ